MGILKVYPKESSLFLEITKNIVQNGRNKRIYRDLYIENNYIRTIKIEI